MSIAEGCGPGSWSPPSAERCEHDRTFSERRDREIADQSIVIDVNGGPPHGGGANMFVPSPNAATKQSCCPLTAIGVDH